MKRNVLRLVDDLGKWTSLPCLIEATRDADVGDMAGRLLDRWLAFRSLRGSTSPSSSQRMAVLRALEGADAGLRERVLPLL